MKYLNILKHRSKYSKNSSILSLLVLILIGCTGFDKNKLRNTDLSAMTLKGKVKMIEENTFQTSSSRGNEPYAFYTRFYYFNEDGIITKKIDDGDNITIVFDSIGNKIEERSFSREQLIKICKFENNRPVSYTSFNPNGAERSKAIITYDENDYATSEASFDENGNRISLMKYKNDSRGNHIKLVKLNERNEVVVINTFKYDQNNNKVELRIHDVKTSMILVTQKYEYNEKNERILTQEFDSQNRLVNSNTRSYKTTYDEMGNWTRKISFTNGVQNDLFSERKIEYYK